MWLNVECTSDLPYFFRVPLGMQAFLSFINIPVQRALVSGGDILPCTCKGSFLLIKVHPCKFQILLTTLTLWSLHGKQRVFDTAFQHELTSWDAVTLFKLVVKLAKGYRKSCRPKIKKKCRQSVATTHEGCDGNHCPLHALCLPGLPPFSYISHNQCNVWHGFYLDRFVQVLPATAWSV